MTRAIPDRLKRGEKLVLSPKELNELHGCDPTMNTMYTFRRQTDSRRGDLGYYYLSGCVCGGSHATLADAIRAAAGTRK